MTMTSHFDEKAAAHYEDMRIQREYDEARRHLERILDDPACNRELGRHLPPVSMAVDALRQASEHLGAVWN